MRSLQALSEHPWIQQLGWTLVQFLWQGTVLSLLYILVRALLPRGAGARLRYGLACSTMGLMTLAPIVTFGVRVANPPAAAWTIATPALWHAALPWIVGAWFTGVVVSTTLLVGGWRVTDRLKAVGIAAPPPDWQGRFEALVSRMRIARPVRLLLSSIVDVPMVLGWWRPVILLPAAALTGLPPAQIESLLAHELAHVRRLDYLVNVLQRAAEALLFYHPAVWWISAQVRAEREACCDDLAVETQGDLVTYMRALAELESRRAVHRTHALAADGGSLLDRIRRLAGQTPLTHAYPGAGAGVLMSALWIAGVGAIGLNAAPRVLMQPTALVTPAATSTGATLAPIASSATTMQPVRPSLASSLLLGPIGPAPLAFVDQLPRPPVAPAPVPTARVEGVVVSTEGGAVPRASLQLVSSGLTLAAKGDDEGRFAFVDVPPGRYVLEATRVGFITGALGSLKPGAPAPPVVLEAGTVLRDAMIKLTPQGVISGQVLNQDGDPLVRSSVRVYQVRYVRGTRTLTSVGNTVTDDEGNYRLANLAPGRYYVGASAAAAVAGPAQPAPASLTSLEAIRAAGYSAGYTSTRTEQGYGLARPDKIGFADVMTFYPTSTDLAGAVPLDIEPGSKFEHMDVRVRRERVSSIRGRVIDPAVGASDVAVMAERMLAPGTNGEGASVLTRQGVFEIAHLPPGTYAIRVYAGASGVTGGVNTVVAGSDVDGVVIDLTPAAPVSGTLTVDSTAASGPPVALGRVRVRLLPADVQAQAVPMLVKEDATFASSTAVAPGRYLLDITSLPAGSYVKAVLYGGADVTRGPLEIGAAPKRLDVVLATNAATATGVIRDSQGSAIAGETVTLWPREPVQWSSTAGIVVATTDQVGRFQALGLAPGEYYAASWEGEPANSGVLAIPELLARFAAEAARVTVTEGARVTVMAPRLTAARIADALSRLP